VASISGRFQKHFMFVTYGCTSIGRHALMQFLQNALAYSATAVNSTYKMFMKLALKVNHINLFFQSQSKIS
jgi:hypothetical protein